jgi:hypothetical protein
MLTEWSKGAYDDVKWKVTVLYDEEAVARSHRLGGMGVDDGKSGSEEGGIGIGEDGEGAGRGDIEGTVTEDVMETRAVVRDYIPPQDEEHCNHVRLDAGGEVEVMGLRGRFAYVRTPDGRCGWVDAAVVPGSSRAGEGVGAGAAGAVGETAEAVDAVGCGAEGALDSIGGGASQRIVEHRIYTMHPDRGGTLWDDRGKVGGRGGRFGEFEPSKTLDFEWLPDE